MLTGGGDNNQYYHSKFLDKSYILDNCACGFVDKKIAIHIHIFYIDMLDIFIDYLKHSPFDFDLLISVNSKEHKDICLKYLSNQNLPKLNNLSVKIVPNVGRDVAPLFVAFKDEQAQYDFVCHIHTKKTPYDTTLKGWCDYLLRNLISQEAIENIIGNFIYDKQIGIIFPPVYSGAFKHILELSDSDKDNMCTLLDKMNISFIPNETNFIFSAGTMFWYRPNALKALFDLNLTYDDFPKEPIGLSGTIAHAIERLPSIVAEHNVYKTKCYITRKELIDSYFNAYINYKRSYNRNKNYSKKHLRVTLFGLPLFKIRKRKLIKFSQYMPIQFKRMR